MGISLGIDVGTVSARWALLGERGRIEGIAASAGRLISEVRHYSPDPSRAVALSRYVRVQGTPLESVASQLREMMDHIDAAELDSVVVTGAGAQLVSDALGASPVNEFTAAATAVRNLYPGVENIFEMGGENSKYIRLGNGDGSAGIVDYHTNGDCAAGTGSFMEQQAGRLCFRVEDIGEVACRACRTPKIAGRCSVFAKSDMIHAQQKGYTPEEVLRGLCEAVARNFKSNIARGRKIGGRTAFIGGVARNSGVAEAVRNVFEIEKDDFLVPAECAYIGAIGSAIIGAVDGNGFDPGSFQASLCGTAAGRNGDFPSWEPLSRERVNFLRDIAPAWSRRESGRPVDAWLGIDIGSVSTNLALIDTDGKVIREVYLRTRARPIETVGRGLKEIEESAGRAAMVRGVGVTGSGRELIGELVGADTVNDEITAHKTGASFIGRTMLGVEVDTIFEIGGQDSKYISMEDGVVVDFAMNEACAAGTGSFLEEQAVRLDVDIIDDFARRAFGSSAPVRLGERCTVYMEQDVSACMKKGAARDDLIAGLAYSVVQNYLNRVVGGRKIGEVVFFQGGTAYNDAVAAAFTRILGREVIVPPYNGVIGAIGAALLAREKTKALGIPTTFRGFDISKIEYSMREFTCGACTNCCDIQEFTVMGRKTYWGDKCSTRYRKQGGSVARPVTPDMMALYRRLIERDYIELLGEKSGLKVDTSEPRDSGRLRAGFPRAMYYYDMYPFWSTYLRAIGMEVVVSPETGRNIINAGIEGAVAEPCLPIQAAHGHILSLLEKDVDIVFVPNVIDAETAGGTQGSYLCPWGQTLPFVARGMSAVEERPGVIESPTVHFREGRRFVRRELLGFARRFGAGKRRHAAALEAAWEAQRIFREDVLEAGAEALEKIQAAGAQGVVVAGRPYNVIDREISLGIPEKLRDYYGVNVIPMFFLGLNGVPVDGAGDNMFWNYGRRILQAARFTAGRDDLHLIYITNFKCGPDSYVKHFCRSAAGRPWLSLQLDAHGNDAGLLTRCEAYLDSKGVLRWWKEPKESSGEGPSTFRGCPREERSLSLQRSGTSG